MQERDPMTKDPVCGMQVSEHSAAGGTSEYHGKTYCFCSPACKLRFDKNPEQYATK